MNRKDIKKNVKANIKKFENDESALYKGLAQCKTAPLAIRKQIIAKMPKSMREKAKEYLL